MSKGEIKNIINTRYTRFDHALKQKARIRLIDEIRKQLKSFIVEPTKNNPKIDLVPSNIVDAIHIPDMLLDEIQKVFSVDTALLSNAVSEMESKDHINDTKTVIESIHAQEVSTPYEAFSASNKRDVSSPNRGYDLMSRIKTSEYIKSLRTICSSREREIISPIRNDYHSPDTSSSKRKRFRLASVQSLPQPIQLTSREQKRESRPIIRKSRSNLNVKLRRNYNDIIDLVSTSSSDSRSSSGDSSKTSTDSNSITSQYKKRHSYGMQHKIKLKFDSENIVNNFEQLILKYLSKNLVIRYKSKFSNSTYTKLHFISCICGSNYNSEKIHKSEITKIQRNLKSKNCELALEFLKCQILNVLNKQKEIKIRENKNKSMQLIELETSKKSVMYSYDAHQRKNADGNNGISKKNFVFQSGSANAAETFTTFDIIGNHENKSDELTINITENSVLDRTQCVNENATTLREVSIEKNTNSSESTGNAETTQIVESFHEQPICDSVENTKSPYFHSNECIAVSRNKIKNNVPPFKRSPSMDLYHALNKNSSFNSHKNQLNKNLQVDLYLINEQNSKNNIIEKSLHEIDLKLKELQKRRMILDEISRKLQKEKIDVEFSISKFHHDKFKLITAAITASATALSGDSEFKSDKYIDVPKKNTSKSFGFVSSTENSALICQPTSKSKESAPPILINSIDTMKPDNSAKFNYMQLQNDKQYDQFIPNNTCVNQTILEDQNQANELFLSSLKLNDIRSPLTNISIYKNVIIGAGENGSLYTFNIHKLVLEAEFLKHNDIITDMRLCQSTHILYTASLDGYMKITPAKKLGETIKSVHIQEPLQCLDMNWNIFYLGTRWGRVYALNNNTVKLHKNCLCSLTSPITTIKTTKEGPRKVIIVCSKGHGISLLDANSGLLLRTFDLPDNLDVCSLLVDNTYIFFGTQKNEIYKFNYLNGLHISVFVCGKGAISLHSYKDKYIIAGCYDGFIYVIDKETGFETGRFRSSDKLILAMEIAYDKVITTGKHNSIQVIKIPHYK